MSRQSKAINKDNESPDIDLSYMVSSRSVPRSVAPTTNHLRAAIFTSYDDPSLLQSHPSTLYGSMNSRSFGSSGSLFSNSGAEAGKTRQCFPPPSTTNPRHFPFHFPCGNLGRSGRKSFLAQHWNIVEGATSQIPAIALVTLFHLMVGIPFGVSYFPVGWKTSLSSQEPDDLEEDESIIEGFTLDGTFPIPGKEALGIRMFLFSTIVGQIVMTYASGFKNCIALQMVENVPFCQALTYIVVKNQGYGKDALSTLFFLFGLASIIVGVVFYLLGRMKLGKILYFFPAHVLVGCIGGIGIFIAKTGLEVAADASFSLEETCLLTILKKRNLLVVVFGFEIGLRLLTRFTKDVTGKPRYPLLSPIYFCLITPVFYLGLWLSGSTFSDAFEAGYFFPPLTDNYGAAEGSGYIGGTLSSSVFNKSVTDIFRIINPLNISWEAVIESIPTLIALVMFSLIHVPINIPAFSVSTNADVDMNVELKSHGYSNCVVGLFGGLQNYMAYTQSLIYYKSGGNGKASSIAVAFSTSFLFFVGPAIASYMPRCMAGTLLLHCGIDLFMEGVYDSYGKYDFVEYTGIWAITVIMTLLGMEAALIAGIISALSTYAIQSVTYLKPIRGSMSAATLRSSAWNRGPEAFEILDSATTGRIKIFVVQLQGHLFFGNISIFTDGVKQSIEDKSTYERPFIVIMDFSLVLGIDSSAAQAIIKLRDSLSKQQGIRLSIFVSGSTNGFPCEFGLSKELSLHGDFHDQAQFCDEESTPNETYPLGKSNGNSGQMLAKGNFRGSHVCSDLDQALVYAEDALISMVDPELLYEINKDCRFLGNEQMECIEEEKKYAVDLLMRKCPSEDRQLVEKFLTYFNREVYKKGEILWKQGAVSDSAKLLVRGDLIAVLENEAGTTETISIGSVIGESGLVQNSNRYSTVHVLEQNTVLYSLSRESWKDVRNNDPKCAHLLYSIVIQYLTLRVQHVSNRIFETRCLPI